MVSTQPKLQSSTSTLPAPPPLLSDFGPLVEDNSSVVECTRIFVKKHEWTLQPRMVLMFPLAVIHGVGAAKALKIEFDPIYFESIIHQNKYLPLRTYRDLVPLPPASWTPKAQDADLEVKWFNQSVRTVWEEKSQLQENQKLRGTLRGGKAGLQCQVAGRGAACLMCLCRAECKGSRQDQ